jgi:hypothetical protein
MYKGWVTVTDANRDDEYIRWILEGDLSLPTAPSIPMPDWTPERTKKIIDGYRALLDEHPWLKIAMENAPSLSELISVQPMQGPPGKVFYFDIVDAKTLEERHKEELDLMTEGLQEGEILKEYEFDLGDLLSMRGGYFVVHKDDPKKILRYCKTRMS